MSSRVLTTLHGRQDLPDNKPIYIGFDEMRLISISDKPTHTDFNRKLRSKRFITGSLETDLG